MKVLAHSILLRETGEVNRIQMSTSAYGASLSMVKFPFCAGDYEGTQIVTLLDCNSRAAIYNSPICIQYDWHSPIKIAVIKLYLHIKTKLATL